MTKKHPSSSRRSEEKKEAEDIFVEKVMESSRWAKANSQLLILAGVAIAVLVAGVFYYQSWQAGQTERAVAELEQVQQAVAFGDREEAKTALYRYLEAFDGTPYALEARLTLGQALLEDSHPEEAMDVLAAAVREMDSQPVGIQAAFLMAAAYEEQGRMEEAERMYLRISNTAELPFQIREAISGAARIRTDQGNFSGAAELYEEVLDGMEAEDPERSLWALRLAEAEARARS